MRISSTDHITPATGKTIPITISKAGGAFGNPSAGATNATEIAYGCYYVTLSTTDTGTLGPLIVYGTLSGIDNIYVRLYVVNANTGGWTALPNAAAVTSGGLVEIGTGANNFRSDSGANVYVSSGTGANQLSLSSGVVAASGNWYTGTPPTASAIATAVWQDLTSSGDFSTSSSIGALLKADVNAPIGSIPTNPYTGTPPTAASIAQAVLTDTTDLTTANSIGKLISTNLNAPVGSIPTNPLTTLGTNAPSGWINAAAIVPGALNGKGDWLLPSGYTAPDNADISTILTAVQNGTYGLSALHTQIGSPWQVGTKYAATLNATDVTGNLPANLIQWNTGTLPTFPIRFSTLAIDTNGDVTFNNTTIGTVTTLTNAPQDSSGVTTLLTRLPYALPMNQVGGSGPYYPTSLVSPGTAAGQLNVIGGRVSATIGPFP